MADLQFPEDILDNIVFRLSTKTFFRFKSVTKHWNSLIPNHFMKLRSKPLTLLSVQGIFHAIDNSVPCDHLDYSIIRSSPLGNLEGNKIIIVGAFNGILLIIFQDQFPNHMRLYNPFTKQSDNVPDPPSCDHTFIYNYGFGYGTTPDDLKIFLLRRASVTHRRSCHVYSFKTRSWDKTALWLAEGYNYKYMQDAGTFVNGFLYWIAHKHGSGRLILALDIKNMEFSEIEFPTKRTFRSVTLGTLNGHLCMICSNSSCCEVWQCNKHGTAESWSKKYSSKLLSRGNYLYEFEPVSMLDEGKIVMIKGSNQVIIHDILKDPNKEVKALTTPYDISRTQIIEYVETLVSPSNLYSS
ncbi:F-box domain-containing protein [Artemisia annua]|uniref:F-box domain-containing protein n=1 Tax=Artemisia annua TaxID=35608 RepID=A0A2U1KQ77_ARTAN|nr:F-box domain-containing protein [Artemisia annua]